jgi:hypothetical protein
VISLLERIAWAAYRAPFSCRKCHARLYPRVLKLDEWEDVPD